MPSRQKNRRVEGGPQGDDAYLVIERLKVAQATALQGDFFRLQHEGIAVQNALKEVQSNGTGTAVKENLETQINDLMSELYIRIAEHIIEWNWVDDDDQPLDQPKERPDVLGELYEDELSFLAQSLGGMVGSQKKES